MTKATAPARGAGGSPTPAGMRGLVADHDADRLTADHALQAHCAPGRTRLAAKLVYNVK
jgi:hypothetical protein